MLPQWFSQTIEHRPESRYCTSAGTRLHYLGWGLGERHKPGLLFVHGYRAHAHYWDFIAPLFVDRFRVAAIDLAGMGDSGRRPAYSAEGFAGDIVAVIEDAQLGPASVAGHSFGGARALRAAADRPDLIRHVIAMDSICQFADGRQPTPLAKTARIEPYPDYASARERFRLVPQQPCDNNFLVDHVARFSLSEVEGGWIWKFDPLLPPGPREPDAAPVLARVEASVDYVRGELSTVISPELANRIVAAVRRGRGPIVLSRAYHYLMLDQPLALVEMLRGLLLDRVAR